MSEESGKKEPMTFLEKLTVCYWVGGGIAVALSGTACVITKFNPWIVGASLIFILVVLLLTGHFTVYTMSSINVASIQAQVAITTAELELSARPEERKIGFEANPPPEDVGESGQDPERASNVGFRNRRH